jgi:hypothetical protein
MIYATIHAVKSDAKATVFNTARIYAAIIHIANPPLLEKASVKYIISAAM